MGINVAEMIADVLKNAATTAEKIQKRAKIVAQLQEAGVHVKWPEGTVRYGIPIEVNKSDLTAIRQVVGRLSIFGKGYRVGLQRHKRDRGNAKTVRRLASQVQLSYQVPQGWQVQGG